MENDCKWKCDWFHLNLISCVAPICQPNDKRNNCSFQGENWLIWCSFLVARRIDLIWELNLMPFSFRAKSISIVHVWLWQKLCARPSSVISTDMQKFMNTARMNNSWYRCERWIQQKLRQLFNLLPTFRSLFPFECARKIDTDMNVMPWCDFLLDKQKCRHFFQLIFINVVLFLYIYTYIWCG